MNRKLHFFALSFVITLLGFIDHPAVYAQAPDLSNAGSYMTYISQQQREVMADFMSYISAVNHGKSARKVNNRRQTMLNTMTEVRRKIATMPGFQGDKSLRDSTVASLMLSYHVLNEDYGKIMNLEEVAEQSYDAMEAYLLAQDIASQKLQQNAERLRTTEKAFAATHHVQLVDTEDDLSRKLEQTNKISDYYYPVYLIFFKSYKQEAYLMDAVGKKDINAIEQNRNTLAKYAAEGLDKLKKIAAFEGDASLLTANRQMLEFYAEECKNKIPSLTNYYLKEENFLKIKKAFEAKREKDRTQADVNQFNNAVNEMNQGVGEYNNTNKQLFDARKKLLDGWNKASENFLDKHTPRYK